MYTEFIYRVLYQGQLFKVIEVEIRNSIRMSVIIIDFCDCWSSCYSVRSIKKTTQRCILGSDLHDLEYADYIVMISTHSVLDLLRWTIFQETVALLRMCPLLILITSDCGARIDSLFCIYKAHCKNYMFWLIVCLRHIHPKNLGT